MVEIETTIIIIVVTIETEIFETTEITIEIIEIVIRGISGKFFFCSFKLPFSSIKKKISCSSGDRNRGDNYNRGGSRNEITRSRDDKEKPNRRDKSAGDPKDFDRMPKYQAPVKPVSRIFSN